MRVGQMGKLLSLDARGKFGYSGGFGRVAFGYTRLGFYNWYCGIYQKRYYYGKPYISRSKFYRPVNPKTVKQQEWRAVFASAMHAWGELDIETKEIWKIKAKREKLPGYSLFTREYLLIHKPIDML